MYSSNNLIMIKFQTGDSITRLKNAINNKHNMLTSTVNDRSN